MRETGIGQLERYFQSQSDGEPEWWQQSQFTITDYLLVKGDTSFGLSSICYSCRLLTWFFDD